jgi:hypothetical protein
MLDEKLLLNRFNDNFSSCMLLGDFTILFSSERSLLSQRLQKHWPLSECNVQNSDLHML